MMEASTTDHHPQLPPELLAAVQEFDAWSQAQLSKPRTAGRQGEYINEQRGSGPTVIDVASTGIRDARRARSMPPLSLASPTGHDRAAAAA
jgi:hypothetical protein